MRKLPTFHGYTVDARLREFRRAIPGQCLEFIPFASPEGEVLLLALLDTLQVDDPLFAELMAVL